MNDNWIENQIRPIALGAQQLSVCWKFARWATSGSRDEPDPVSPPELARPGRVSEGCAHTLAHTTGQPDHKPATTQLAVRRVIGRLRL